MATPGAVVLIDFIGAVTTKRRPAVVLSSDLYHSCRPDVILGLLTTDLAQAMQPTDYILQDWASAGLHIASAFRSYILTRPVTDVIREIGRLSDRDWAEVRGRVRLALAV